MTIRQCAVSLLLLVLAGNGPSAELSLQVQHQRNAKGVLHICLSAERRYFPDCSHDPGAIRRIVPAISRTIVIAGISPGRYAVTAFHDENLNHKLDTMLGIPREGFGFSRNPVVRFGAPEFEHVTIQLEPGFNRHAVRMKYLL